MITRRQLLQTFGLALGSQALLPGTLLAATADTAQRPRLIVLILRGGLDGLHAVAPIGDPDYARQRGDAALAKTGDEAALPLDADFALHPALSELHARYQAGEALILHAAATPYRSRSHFDAQDVLDSGLDTAGRSHSGWLNRALSAGVADAIDEGGVGIGAQLPLILRGPAAVGSWAPSNLPDPQAGYYERIAALYADDPALAQTLNRAIELHTELSVPNRVRGARAASPPALAAAAARLLAADTGPSIATVEISGWDSHNAQFRPRSALTRSLAQLDVTLAALRKGLGAHWQRSAVLVVTEFGRTVRPNGSSGTDHGTAGCAFLLGGAVRGGRVIADWPGLADQSLYEGRDLRPTLDLRAVFKGVLHDHLRVGRRALNSSVFPDTGKIRPLKDLIA
jgi:uncharacterized protein (DUF1501 family)